MARRRVHRNPVSRQSGGRRPLDEDVSTKWMAAVAQELGVSDTAFVLKRRSRSAISGCGGSRRRQRSIFAATRRWRPPTACSRTRRRPDPVPDPNSGILIVRRRSDGSLVMDFPVSAPTAAYTATRDAVAEALGAAVEWAGCANDGFFVLAQLVDERAVQVIVPNLAAIASLEASAVIVTALADHGCDYDFVSRVFAPKIGIPEDPVTGSSHTVLASFWADRLASTALVGFQASHRPGRLDVELHKDRVSIAGRAVTVVRRMITAAATPATA